jgi:plasmid stabilization system protein ParE
MKRYSVVFEESAQAEVRKSYDWGYRFWGKKEAQRWVRELRAAVLSQLSILPKGFPVAPEDDEFSEEIRQMIVGRYRVLFTIRKGQIHVLHIRGPYSF